MALLIWLMEALNVWWVVEQPAGSLLMQHPRLQAVLKRFNIYVHKFAMHDFGHPATKPTWLYSNRKWIDGLNAFKLHEYVEVSQRLTERCTDRVGRETFTGNADTKASQAYPDGFGFAMTQLYRQHDAELKRDAAVWEEYVLRTVSVESVRGILHVVRADDKLNPEGWVDAKLGPVFEYLSR